MGASAEGEELQMQKKKKKNFPGVIGGQKEEFQSCRAVPSMVEQRGQVQSV